MTASADLRRAPTTRRVVRKGNDRDASFSTTYDANIAGKEGRGEAEPGNS